MLNLEGFTAEGLERKATCTALFKKMLYLTESEALLAQDSEAAASVDLRKVGSAGRGLRLLLCLQLLLRVLLLCLLLTPLLHLQLASPAHTTSPATLLTSPLLLPPCLQVFGATDEDMDKVRIVSLVELDMDKLDRMASGQEDGSSSSSEQQGSKSL